MCGEIIRKSGWTNYASKREKGAWKDRRGPICTACSTVHISSIGLQANFRRNPLGKWNSLILLVIVSLIAHWNQRWLIILFSWQNFYKWLVNSWDWREMPLHFRKFWGIQYNSTGGGNRIRRLALPWLEFRGLMLHPRKNILCWVEYDRHEIEFAARVAVSVIVEFQIKIHLD